jgi:hypothetical protein
MTGLKKEKRLLIVAFAMILLTSNLTTVFASASINKHDSSGEVLPEYLLLVSKYLSKGNTTELARIRQEMIRQEQIKQDRIKSTNGAVLNFSPPESPLDDEYYWYMDTVEYVSPDQYDIYDELIGHVDDAEEMTWDSDDDCALLETFGWDKNYSDPEPDAGEALVNGYMEDWALGDIYVRACQGPNSGSDPPWSNYVQVWVNSNYNNETWRYVGYAQARSTTLEWIYIGTCSLFNVIAVCCITPPQHPDWYEPIILNSVYVDSAVAYFEL